MTVRLSAGERIDSAFGVLEHSMRWLSALLTLPLAADNVEVDDV